MDINQEFKDAVDRSSTILQRPTDEELLELYAQYKQATEGDVKGDRPGGFDFKGAAKYDAWAELKGQDQVKCMSQYVELVDTLIKKYNT